MTILVWPSRDKKTTPLDMEEELMIEAWCLLKNEEEHGLLPFSTLPLMINIAH